MITGVDDSVLVVFISAVLVNNLVLEWQLALSPFLAGSRRIDVAMGLALTSLVVMTTGALIGFALHHFLLVPLALTWMSLILVLFSLVVLMQLTAGLIKSRWPGIDQKYGVFLPLLMLNSSILAVVLITIEKAEAAGMAFVFSLGSATGFGLVLVLFAGLRERLERTVVPKTFKGIPISLITLGLFSIAFSGF